MKLKIKDRFVTHKWFAWYPVRCGAYNMSESNCDYYWVLFETVNRKYTLEGKYIYFLTEI